MDRVGAIWVNGKPIRSVSAVNRGLEFGDGIFETIRYHRGKLISLECHLNRLSAGLEKLFFPSCLLRVRSDLNTVLDCLRLTEDEDVIIRVTVTRGEGQRGYTPESSSFPTVIVRASVSYQNPRLQADPMKVELSDLKLGIQPSLAGIKHINRLEQVLASIEKRERSVDELLMISLEGLPVSFITGNLFIREGASLHTPIIKSCGIEGTRRSLILSTLAPMAKYTAFESLLTLKRILSADELIFCNTVTGIRSIRTLGPKDWCDHSASAALHKAYVKKCLD